MYTLEKSENLQRLGCENLLKPILTSVDLASLDLQLELSEIGQFADLAHGTLSSEL